MNQEILLIPPLIVLFALLILVTCKAYKEIKGFETRKSKSKNNHTLTP